MKAPMILPWVAKKAGISEELALKLWRRAVGEAGQLVSSDDFSEYSKLILERFLSLVDDEARIVPTDRLAPAPRLSWICRHQTRMSLLSLTAAENTYRYWQHAWQNLLPQKAA